MAERRRHRGDDIAKLLRSALPAMDQEAGDVISMPCPRLLLECRLLEAIHWAERAVIDADQLPVVGLRREAGFELGAGGDAHPAPFVPLDRHAWNLAARSAVSPWVK